MPRGAAPAMIADVPPVSPATNAQVAELMDDMLVFQSDTRNTMFGLVCVLGVVALAALASRSACSSADTAILSRFARSARQ